jgi:type IV pilus assembly protein PilV
MSVTIHNSKRARGFSLIEVLVAMIILAVGLLGLASLQARGLKFNHDAYVRSQATTLAYDIMDRMRANRDSANLYTSAPTGVCDPTTASVPNDVRCWNDALGQLLPGGASTIAVNLTDATMFDITIRWLDRERDVADQGQCEAVAARAWVAGSCFVTQTWTFLP